MEALRQRDELRLWLQEEEDEASDAGTAALTRQFGRALGYRRLIPKIAWAAGIACLLGLGGAGHALLGSTSFELAADPEHVLADDAAQAWRLIQLAEAETNMTAAIAEPLPAAQPARLPVHAWPEGVQPLRAETIDWQGGTAVIELAATTGGDELVLLQAKVEADDARTPGVETVGGVTTIAWREDGVAYALSSDLSVARLLTIAQFIDART
jgi:anti-sigma factor RsiW